MWGDRDWDDDRSHDPPGPDDAQWAGAGGRGSPRAKVVYAIVLGAAMLASIVLCCVAAGEASQLLWLELPPP